MSDGWVKLHRQIMDSQVWQNDGLLKVFMYCLLKANHKGRWVQITTGRGTSEVWVGPGQFLFGRKTAAKELKRTNPETVRYRMHKLQRMGMITLKSNTHYSIITIGNWDTYQGLENNSTNQLPTNYQPTTTNKNDKNDKNKEKETVTKKKKTGSSAKAIPPPDSPKSKIIRDVVDYLNTVCETKFKHTTRETREHITARLNEGYTFDDFKTVIDRKAKDWKDDEKMVKFLRPNTLFLPSKFEAYLNERRPEDVGERVVRKLLEAEREAENAGKGGG